jgi:hypothetical protein
MQAGAYGQILHLARQKGYAPLELSGLDRTVLDRRDNTAGKPVTQVRIAIL